MSRRWGGILHVMKIIPGGAPESMKRNGEIGTKNFEIGGRRESQSGL